ncbi:MULTISPECIES: hypothetical protein [Sanguibacteroides]|uniref:PEGA domain-containing protein n=2 Tax=Sanguibacteroides justesenii TaxID=1547597 RepID=A0A0C3NID9_9PORP|nr:MULTISPECIES: hypothetical protein [Sanguibacteroides]KIO45902.1 hypothetical protein BA92_05500 [Sanguibacteroides justesenii]
MKKILFLLMFWLATANISAQLIVLKAGPNYNIPVTIRRIAVTVTDAQRTSDKRLHSPATEVWLTIDGEKHKCKFDKYNSKYDIDYIPDSMVIEVKHPGYKPAKYNFYKKLYTDSSQPLLGIFQIYMTKEGDTVNYINTLNNKIEISINNKITAFKMDTYRKPGKFDTSSNTIAILSQMPEINIKPGKEEWEYELYYNGAYIRNIIINGNSGNYEYEIYKLRKRKRSN